MAALRDDANRRPKGIWSAVLLPVTTNDTIDMVAMRDQVDYLCQSEVAGIYTNGTACEFFNQTEAEFDAISQLVAERATKFAKPFQIGVSNTNPRLARERLKRVKTLNPFAVQITLPDWWPPSQADCIRYVAGMQDVADDTALVLYNPPTAKVNLTVAQIAELLPHAPNLVGVKVLGGDDQWFAERRKLLPNFAVFVAGHRVAHGRPLGADGAYSNVACLSPNGAVAYWDLIETDAAAAQNLESRFQKMLQNVIMPLAKERGLSDAALDKLMAAVGGYCDLHPRLLWPYASATLEDVKTVREKAKTYLQELIS